MGSTLKDALLQIGIRSSKAANERSKIKGRQEKQSEKHQKTRTFCEICASDHADVEHYKHRNPTIDARWICLSCADKNMIDDKFRVTEQSEFSLKKCFKRFYGATRSFHGFEGQTSNPKTSIARKKGPPNTDSFRQGGRRSRPKGR